MSTNRGIRIARGMPNTAYDVCKLFAYVLLASLCHPLLRAEDSGNFLTDSHVSSPCSHLL